jgi:hypothetical protein
MLAATSLIRPAETLARLIHGDDVEAVISRARGSGHGFSPRRFRREAA